jgi:hypothetical protein
MPIYTAYELITSYFENHLGCRGQTTANYNRAYHCHRASKLCALFLTSECHHSSHCPVNLESTEDLIHKKVLTFKLYFKWVTFIWHWGLHSAYVL